jgi:hypothetical protein
MNGGTQAEQGEQGRRDRQTPNRSLKHSFLQSAGRPGRRHGAGAREGNVLWLLDSVCHAVGKYRLPTTKGPYPLPASARFSRGGKIDKSLAKEIGGQSDSYVVRLDKIVEEQK